MARLGRVTSLLLSAAQCSGRGVLSAGGVSQAAQGCAPALFAASQTVSKHCFSTSKTAWATTVPTEAPPADLERREKYKALQGVDPWEELWAHDPRFGTETSPITVPALLAERIIGVTDPEDDTLVIWGILREGEPPKQLVAGGEFFVLQRVKKIERVGDALGFPLT